MTLQILETNYCVFSRATVFYSKLSDHYVRDGIIIFIQKFRNVGSLLYLEAATMYKLKDKLLLV